MTRFVTIIFFTAILIPSLTIATDLKLTKTAAYCFNIPGLDNNFTITVQNNSSVEAINAVLSDTIPEQYTASSAVPTQGSCASDGTNTLTCSLGNIPAGESVTVTIYAVLNSDVVRNIDIVNSATVTADNEINPSDNTGSVTVVSAEVDEACEEAEISDSSGCSLIKPLVHFHTPHHRPITTHLRPRQKVGRKYRSLRPMS